jgi:hypothetical protein
MNIYRIALFLLVTGLLQPGAHLHEKNVSSGRGCVRCKI